MPAAANADNIFQKIARIGTTQTEAKEDTQAKDETANTKKGGKKSKNAISVDPYELSLDENLRVPEINEKQHDIVASYMNELAKKLAQRKVARIETMRSGEVVVATISTDLLFAQNDTVLRPTAPEILSPYRALLSRGDMYKLVVTCHTDDAGSPVYTDRLSESRVNAVDQWLSRNLTSEPVLVPYAMGATEPLYENDSQSHRAANRRVEIFIVPSDRLIELAKSGKLTSEALPR